jgi:hypothetical protein
LSPRSNPGTTSADEDIIPLPDDAGYDYQLPVPEPQYRPFANAAEFEPHRDRWITRGRLPGFWRPLGYDEAGVFSDDRRKIEWADLFREYQFEDGTPFGVEVTQ